MQIKNFISREQKVKKEHFKLLSRLFSVEMSNVNILKCQKKTKKIKVSSRVILGCAEWTKVCLPLGEGNSLLTGLLYKSLFDVEQRFFRPCPRCEAPVPFGRVCVRANRADSQEAESEEQKEKRARCMFAGTCWSG